MVRYMEQERIKIEDLKDYFEENYIDKFEILRLLFKAMAPFDILLERAVTIICHDAGTEKLV